MVQIATSLDQVKEFLCGTLLSVQQMQLCVEKSLWEVVQQCIDLLREKNLITVTSDSHSQSLQVTKLGKATYKGKPHFHVLKCLLQDVEVHAIEAVHLWTTASMLSS